MIKWLKKCWTLSHRSRMCVKTTRRRKKMFFPTCNQTYNHLITSRTWWLGHWQLWAVCLRRSCLQYVSVHRSPLCNIFYLQCNRQEYCVFISNLFYINSIVYVLVSVMLLWCLYVYKLNIRVKFLICFRVLDQKQAHFWIKLTRLHPLFIISDCVKVSGLD